MGRAAIVAGGKNDWATRPEFVRGIERWFGRFDLDVCALPGNTKAPRFYTPGDDGLAQAWDEPWWCNPPWGRGLIDPWVERAIGQTREHPGIRGAMLLPVKSEQAHWRLVQRHSEAVLFVEGRQRFVGATSGVTVPTALVLWGVDLGGPRYGRISREGAIL